MRKIILILGAVGILIGGAILLISLLLPSITRGVSWEEASVGIVAGLLLLLVSIAVAVLGLVLVLMNKKRAGE
jgi:cytochrome c biogenesis factor